MPGVRSSTLPENVSLLLIENAVDRCREDLKVHYSRLGRRSRRLRFMSEPSTAALERMAERAQPELMLEVVEDGSVRGVLEAYATAPGHAEVALSVEDGYQGRGLGRLLLEEGLHALSDRGFGTADLLCLPENTPILQLVREAGGTVRFQDGEAVVAIDLHHDGAAEERRAA